MALRYVTEREYSKLSVVCGVINESLGRDSCKVKQTPTGWKFHLLTFHFDVYKEYTDEELSKSSAMDIISDLSKLANKNYH